MTFGGGALLYALILLVTPWHLGILFGTVIPGRLLVHLTPVMLLATVSLLWRLDSESPEATAVPPAPEPEPEPAPEPQPEIG